MLYILLINNMNWLILFIVSLFPLIGLVPNGLPVTHDGADHVARIANFFQALSEGVIVPRWAGNLNWGYGHPILMFLYPLSSYAGSFFHAVGFSYVDATKMVFAVAFIASVLAMYLWINTAFGKRAGIIAALLYGFAPYRFVDLYVRGAIGEHVAFIFPPLILFFLYKLAAQRKNQLYGIGLSVSMACLIVAHNAIAIMFLPIIGAYCIYLFFTEAKKSVWFLLSSACFSLLGFGLSSFFWIPAFFEGKYTLRDILTRGEFGDRFIPWTWFFNSPWNYGQGNEFSKSLGYGHWIGILTSIMVLLKTKDAKRRIFLTGLIIILFGSLFMMTSQSSLVWNKITLLQKFQFPWRFLSVSVFLSALLGGISIASLVERTKSQKRAAGNYVVIAFCLVAVLTTIHMWKPKGYSTKPESFYSGVYESTTDTGESSPIWSIRFMEYAPSKRIDVIGGKATVVERSRTTIEHVYTIVAITPSQLLENTLYFPGWKVYVDGVQTEIEFQDPNHRGIMTFRIDEGVHEVRVVFQNTKIRTYAEYISLISIGICSMLIIWRLIWRKK